MDEQLTEVPAATPKPKPKRKYTRRKARPARAAPAVLPKGSPYQGLTVRSCCDDCRIDRCVITHEGFCGHPTLGMQPTHLGNQEIVERRRQAKQYLAVLMAEKKNA